MCVQNFSANTGDNKETSTPQTLNSLFSPGQFVTVYEVGTVCYKHFPLPVNILLLYNF